MTLKLNNPIWDKAKRANLFSKALYAVGKEAVRDIAEVQDKSIPAGRTYRKRRVARSIKGKAPRIAGFKLHRASRSGQPPAKDTKRLYRGTKLRRLAAYRIRIYNDVPYARHLEPPARLNRPFFYSTIRRNTAKYRQMIEKAARGLT